jgi:hypothetical protein
MNHIGRHSPLPEPDPKLVECAIAKMLEMAGRQGITAAEFIQMLDSGMRVSDFLDTIDTINDGPDAGQTIAGYDIDCDAFN